MGLRVSVLRVTVPAAVAVGAAAVAAAVVLSGGGSGVSPSGDRGGRAVENSVYRAPTVWLPTANADDVVPFDRHLVVMVGDGRLASVTVTDERGQPLAGAISTDGSLWTSTVNPIPLERYRAAVTIRDSRGDTSSQVRQLSVSDSANHLVATLSPGDGNVVGVGQPVVVTFNRWVPEAERPAVEQRLSVTTSPAVAGAWHWFNGQEVHWRPENFWTKGTTVQVRADLGYLHYGDGIWGQRAVHTTSFRIGSAHVSKVDVAQHTMQVFSDGQLVKTFKVSAGRDKYPTMGGTLITLDKAPEIVMDSATVGIPRNSPDGYYEKVQWDVRLTNGGAFVHSAPWSVNDQGSVNVSHGCVNLAPSDAQWFYEFTQRGDVVQISGTPRPPNTGDAGAFDWNTPWSVWTR